MCFSSDTMCPSFSTIERFVRAATSGSCVTMMIVRPSRLSLSSRSRISLGRHRVEVARRLVGQDEFGVVHQAAGDGHALLLAAGELRRPVVEPLAQADHFGQLAAPPPRRRVDAVAVVQRHLDVLDDRQRRAANCTIER